VAGSIVAMEDVVEKWHVVASLFGVGEAVVRGLCKRFSVNPDERVAIFLPLVTAAPVEPSGCRSGSRAAIRPRQTAVRGCQC
jgi:hypothetical protein